MKPLKESHLKFIQLIAEGKPQGEAYRVTIGKSGVSQKVSDVKASQLCKRYASQIASEREKIQSLVVSAKDSEVVRIALKSVLSQAEVDAKLSSIIDGSFLSEDVMFVSGKPMKVKRTPNAGEVSKAIDLYNKRFGANAPSKIDATVKDLTVVWNESHPNESDNKTE